MLKISEAALSVGSSSSTRLQRPLEFHSVRKPSWWSFSNNKTPQKTLGKSETETAAETVSAAVLEKDSSLLVWRCCCPSAAGVVVDQLPRTIKGTPSVSVLVEARLILKASSGQQQLVLAARDLDANTPFYSVSLDPLLKSSNSTTTTTPKTDTFISPVQWMDFDDLGNLWILIAPSRLLVTFSCLKQAIHTLRQDPSKQQEIKQSTKLALTPLPPSLSLSNMTLANDLQYPASRNPHVVCMYSTPNNQYDEKTGLFNSNTTFIFLAGSGDTPLLVFSSEKGAKPLLLDSLPQAYFHESRQLDSTTGHDAADGRVHEFEDHHPRPIDFVQVRIDPSHRYLILLDGTAGRIYILHPTLLTILYTSPSHMKLRDFNFVSLPNTPKRMLTISAVISSTSSSSSSIAFLRVPSFEIIYEFAGVTQYCSLVTESTSPQSTLNNNSNENDDDKLDEDGSTILWYTDIEQGSKPPHRFLASLNTSAPASHVARLIADKQFTTALEYIRKHDEIASDHHDNGLGIDAQGVLKAKMAYILENLNSSYFEDELIVGEGGEAEDEEAVGGDKPDKSTVQSRRCVVDTADIFSSLDQIEDKQFCIKFCLRVILPSFKLTRTFLNYALSAAQSIPTTITHHSSTSSAADCLVATGASKAITAVSRAVKRLGTYILLKGAASAASSPLSYSNSSSASKVVPSNSNATADQENTDGCKDSEEDKEADWDGEDWQDFRMADMLSEMREYFRDGDMDGAILIWRRHHIDMGGLLDYNNNNNIVGGGRRHHQSVLTALLREIPVWVGAAKFVSWLRDEVVPFITHHEEIAQLRRWIQHRALLAEQRDQSPHNALAIISLVDAMDAGSHAGSSTPTSSSSTKTMSLSAPVTPARYTRMQAFKGVSVTNAEGRKAYNEDTNEESGGSSQGLDDNGDEDVDDNCGDDDEEVIDGRTEYEACCLVKKQLLDLVYLWDHHDFKISLSEYVQTTVNQIAFELLNRVAALELLPSAIADHVQPYVFRNELELQVVFYDYCLELMDTLVLTEDLEARLIMLIDRIDVPDMRVDLVLEFMQRIRIPWSGAVHDLIRRCFVYVSARRCSELATQFRLIRLKSALTRYDLAGFEVSNLALIKGLLERITSRIDVIDALDDALLTVSVYPGQIDKYSAFTSRLKHLCRAGELDRACRLLLNGKEDGSITSLGPSTKSINSSSGDILRLFHGEDDDFLDISKDCIISKAESLSMGHAVTVWLTEIMNYTAESIKRLDLGTAGCNTDEEQDDDDYYCLFSMNRNECLEAYGWSLKACIAISRAMMELKHQLLNQCVFDSSSSSNSNKSSGVLSLQQQQHHAQRGGSFTSSTAFSSPIGASVPPGALRSHEPTRSSTIYATESSLKVFKDLYSLLMDFDLALGWKGYHDRSTKRSCLRSASRVVFDIYAAATSRGKGKSFKGDKSNSTISHARVYKLAELLGYERVFLTGILAEEACCCGDLKAAVLLCKEMVEKAPSSTHTSRILRNITHLIMEYLASDIGVLTASKSDFRITQKLVELSQQALLSCSEDMICESMDDFKNYELQHSVFAMCDAGEYGDVMSRSSVDKVYHASSSFSTSSSSSSSSSSSTLKHNHVVPDLGNTSSDKNTDSFAAELFLGKFKEGGLVLNTDCAMSKMLDFIRDVNDFEKLKNADIGLRNVGIDGDSVTSISKIESNGGTASGKRKARSIHPIDSGRDLWNMLRQNRNSYPALCVLHRAIDSYYRYSCCYKFANVPTEEFAQGEREAHIEIVLALLQTILGLREIDQNLAICCVFSLPSEATMIYESIKNSIGDAVNDFLRIVKISKVAIIAAMSWGQRGAQISFKEYAESSKWFHQFQLLDIPFEASKFRSSRGGDYQRLFVRPLLEKTGLDLLTVLEFSRNYQIEDDFVLFEYLRQLLLESDLTVDHQASIAGVIEDVENKDKLVKLLCRLYTQQISPYDYERLQFVISMIRNIRPDEEESKMALAVLEVIWGYQRQRPPPLDELEKAFKFMAGADINTTATTEALLLEKFPLSRQRLPFQLIADGSWTIVEEELCEASVNHLIPLSRPLGIPADKFYTTVIANMLKKMSLSPQAFCTNTESSKVKFSDFKPFLLKIKEKTVAIEFTNQIANFFPCSPDKINAHKWSLILAEKAAKQAGGDASIDFEHNLREFQLRVFSIEIEYQLRSHKLEDMLKFMENPTELICQLYSEKSELALNPKEDLDLHGIAEYIATRNNVDMYELLSKLLDKWLGEEVLVNEKDKSQYLPSIRLQLSLESPTCSEKAIRSRLLYLLQNGLFSDKNVQLLLKFSYSSSSRIRTLNRVRALSVLLALASPEELDGKVGEGSAEEIRNYLQCLLYLSDFEELRIIQKITDFQKCDKEALARSLWVNHNNEPKAIQLICNICIDFGIFDLVLWEKVLERLQQYGAIYYLLGLLEHVTSIPELSLLKSLPTLWNNAMVSSLEYFKSQLTVDVFTPAHCSVPTDDCEHPQLDLNLFNRIISLIQKCPFLSEIDLPRFHSLFTGLMMNKDHRYSYHLALLGLAALPPSMECRRLISGIVSGLKEEEYIVLLNNVYPGKVALNAAAAAAASDDTTTILSSLSTCSSKDLVSGEVFDLLDQTKSYSLLINTRHLGTLISHLIRGDRLDGLLLETIKAKRLKAASDLVYQFYQQHGDRLPLTEEEEEEEGDDDDAVLPNQLVVGTIDKFTREELTRIYLEQHPNLQRQVVVSSITDK